MHGYVVEHVTERGFMLGGFIREKKKHRRMAVAKTRLKILHSTKRNVPQTTRRIFHEAVLLSRHSSQTHRGKAADRSGGSNEWTRASNRRSGGPKRRLRRSGPGFRIGDAAASKRVYFVEHQQFFQEALLNCKTIRAVRNRQQTLYG
jgi:hypothetical protein